MRHFQWKRSWLLGLLVSLVALSVACGEAVEQEDPRPEDERNAEPAPLNDKVFVTAQELQAFADDGATILDVRPIEDYEAGHFPGAVHVDGGRPWKDDNGILITDVLKAQNQVRDLGIDRDRPVVIYGEARSKGAGRLFWTLEYFGHGKVHLYAPSYETLADGLDFDEETSTPDVEEGDFVVAYRDSVIATAGQVKTAIDDETAILIDTRREGEYEGTEDRGDPRQGRLPGSIWYYWENIFDDDDNLKSEQDLRDEFDQNGLLADGAVIVPYCQTGTRSAYIYAVLRMLGKDDNKNYDGSWVEWSRDPDLPIVEPQDEPSES
jgi:thiosulfate/3-mercaptopyruvate sulfurtransferase